MKIVNLGRLAVFFEECFWNIYAIAYDVLANLRPYQEMHQRVIEILKIQSGESILDAGCGTGNLLKSISHRSTGSLQIEGCDFSSTMLARARKKIPEAKLWRADFNQGIGTDRTYNNIVSTNVAYVLLDPAKFIKNLYAQLEPGGTLVVVTPHKDMNSWRVIEDHLRGQGFSAILSLLYLSLPLLIVASANFVIDMRERIGSYNPFDEAKLESVFSQLGNFDIERTYAGQALLAVVHKPEAVSNVD